MKAMEQLSAHLKTRLVDLNKARAEGRKIIGYTPGGYLPEELVLASGVIPVCLIRGGDHSVVELAGAYICRWIDTFCRAQIGYGVSKDDPYYTIVDLLAIPVTDNPNFGCLSMIEWPPKSMVPDSFNFVTAPLIISFNTSGPSVLIEKQTIASAVTGFAPIAYISLRELAAAICP